MPAAEITRLRDQHIQRFYAHLRAIYARGRGCRHDFDQFPLAVQMALFDMIFNFGPSRLVNVFVGWTRLSAPKIGRWRRPSPTGRKYKPTATTMSVSCS